MGAKAQSLVTPQTLVRLIAPWKSSAWVLIFDSKWQFILLNISLWARSESVILVDLPRYKTTDMHLE